MAVKERRRLKTPSKRVFKAAANELAPKICIVRDATTPGAENNAVSVLKTQHRTNPAKGTQDSAEKGGIKRTDPTQAKPAVRRQGKREGDYVP